MLSKKIKSASVNKTSIETPTIPNKKSKQSKNSTKSPTNNNDQQTISPFFTIDDNQIEFWQKFYGIECRLSAELKKIPFQSSTISAVYNPIEYASDLHCAYLKKYLNGPISVLFIGMNPGPYGMCQTGVPFGHVPAVKDYLKLNGLVEKPENELAARPIYGLDCDRAEQSGQRFWSLVEGVCSDAEHFFRNCFVHNLCPLAFFHSSGRNLTPAEIKSDKRKLLQDICAQSMEEVIRLLSPKLIVSIGRYAEDRVKEVFKGYTFEKSIEHKCIPHPSPRALNNTKWNEKAEKWLNDNDVMKLLKE